MNGHLTSLLKRAMAPEPSIRPRLPSIFDPPMPDARGVAAWSDGRDPTGANEAWNEDRSSTRHSSIGPVSEPFALAAVKVSGETPRQRSDGLRNDNPAPPPFAGTISSSALSEGSTRENVVSQMSNTTSGQAREATASRDGAGRVSSTADEAMAGSGGDAVTPTAGSVSRIGLRDATTESDVEDRFTVTGREPSLWAATNSRRDAPRSAPSDPASPQTISLPVQDDRPAQDAAGTAPKARDGLASAMRGRQMESSVGTPRPGSADHRGEDEANIGHRAHPRNVLGEVQPIATRLRSGEPARANGQLAGRPAAPQPTIHVTIGRIEVKASTVAEVRAKSPTTSAPGLDDYLRQRSRRGSP